VKLAGVRTGVHVFAICVKTGITFKRNTSFFHVSVPSIYGTGSSIYLIIFLKVISKVLFFNITQKFTNLLVQLSIFFIELFVGTYRLSSHARLEAFVIQTKLEKHKKYKTRKRPDANLFLLVQMHHKILEQFTLFKQPSS